MDTSIDAPTLVGANRAGDGGFDAHGLHAVWQRCRRRARMRSELRAMDARTLADIGLDPESARQDTHECFWHG